MFYAVLGRLVWWGAKRYTKKKYGNRPRQVAIGLAVAGGIGVAVLKQRRAEPSA